MVRHPWASVKDDDGAVLAVLQVPVDLVPSLVCLRSDDKINGPRALQRHIF